MYMLDEMDARIQQKIDEYFNTKWYTEDFLEGYKTARKIEDMTEKDFEDFEKCITTSMLYRFRETVIQEINERITYLF